MDYYAFHYAGTAARALAQLDEVYAAWLAGVQSLGDAGLARPCGPAEGPFAESPMATLVLHVRSGRSAGQRLDPFLPLVG